MVSVVRVGGQEFPQLKVSGRESLPETLNLQDRLLLTGELCACSSQIGSAVDSGLYYYVSVKLSVDSVSLLQKLKLDSGHAIDPVLIDSEVLSVIVKKRAITYNKPVPPIRVYHEGKEQALFAEGKEIPIGSCARVAATLTPFEREGEKLFDLCLGVIQVFE